MNDPVKTKPATPAAAKPARAVRKPAPPAKQPVATARPATVSKEEPVMQDTINTAADQATQRGQAMFADASERTKDAMAKGQKMFEDLGSYGKGNVEALVESSKIAARGFETMGQDYAAYAKRSFDGAAAAMKQFAQVKSPTELMKLQADYTRTAFDAFVAESSRTTEQALKLAGEVAQPISNRLAVGADFVKAA